MPLFRWNDKFITHHEMMDRDHRKLVELVNQLADAMGEGKGKDVCGRVLNELIDYTRTHFAMEEALMATHGYYGARQHKAEHAQLIQEVVDFKAKYEADDAALSAYLLYFLRDWLVKHIMDTDKAFAAAILSKEKPLSER